VAAVNDPQIWTLIAAFVGLQGVTLALTLRQIGSAEAKLQSQIGGLRDEMRVRFDGVDRRFEHVEATMNSRFDHQAEIIKVRFGALEQRVTALDDDMKLVKAHLIPPAA
jgi:hypothetical protein